VVAYEVDPWSALGDGTRRAIFERLVERPSAVGELALLLPVSRPAVSQHLRVLKPSPLLQGGANFFEITGVLDTVTGYVVARSTYKLHKDDRSR
jgi:DNA-binding transcriptional ArsR family regulator